MTKFWLLCIATAFVLLELAPASADPCPGSDTCPTQQYAVAGGPTEVTVSWVQPDTLPAYFIVSRSQSGSGFAVIGQQTTGNPNDPETYADYKVQPNASYVYQICGWYSAGQQACATTNTVTTPPIASDTATRPPTITRASSTANSITISWNGNATYEFYNVSQVLLNELGIEQPSQTPAPGGASGSHTFSNLQPTTGYQVAVQGCQPGETSSNCSQWTTKSIWTQSPPPPPPPMWPGNLQTQVEGGSILVLWNNPPGVLNGTEWSIGWVGTTVTRTPAWPSASTLFVSGPYYDNLYDTWIETGQVYTYNVCLNFRDSNPNLLDSLCEGVTGEVFPQHPTPVVAPPSTPIIHVGPFPWALGAEHMPTLPSTPIVHKGPFPWALLAKHPVYGKRSQSPVGPCKPELVWREAYVGDRVCVTTPTRAQVVADNQAAAQHQSANGQCVQGYVWRLARPRDRVCVTPPTHAQIAKDNAAGGTTRASGMSAPITHPRPLPTPAGAAAGGFEKQTSLGSCKLELVRREAYTGDKVCVTSQTRAQAAADNQAAAQRQTASGQCIQGYVWRQARPQDHVCVTPQTRAQTAKDNAAAGAS
jgi:hypothetical protein